MNDVDQQYQSWRWFREAWLTLEGLDPPNSAAARGARDEMAVAQSRLDELCSTLLAEAATFKRLGEYDAVRKRLDRVRVLFPREDQVCPLHAERLRSDYGL